MGIFSKSKKQNAPASPASHSTTSGTTSTPGSPLNNFGHHDLQTATSTGSDEKHKFQLPDVKRASGFFDLNLADPNDLLSNPPPPAPAPTHRHGDGPLQFSQSAIKHHQNPENKVRISPSVSSFYDSIPQMTNNNKNISSHHSQQGQPALLLKPPILSSHKRIPSEDQSEAFNGFDGVFVKGSPTVSSAPFVLSDAPTDSQKYQQSISPTLTQDDGYKNANDENKHNTPSLDANIMSKEVPEPSFASSMRAAYLPEPSSPASSHYSTAFTVEESPIDSTPTPFSFQNMPPNEIQPRNESLPLRNTLDPIPIPAPLSSDPLRSPLGSPSAAAAAMASASLKSQLKIGTVKVVESQQANVELAENNFYAGEEGFSSLDHSAETTQPNSDDEDEQVQKNITYTANHPIIPTYSATKPRANSGSDSSYVNVASNNTDVESLSSGVVVAPVSKNATPTEASHPYRSASDYETGPAQDNTVPSDPQPSANTDDAFHFDHQRYNSATSEYSASTFMSDFNDIEDLKLYHPQPHRPSVGPSSMPKNNSKIRSSIISTASSNILNSSGGIPNVDVLSISDSASTKKPDQQLGEQEDLDRERVLKDTQAQLMQGSANPIRQSMPTLQRRNSRGRPLTSLMPPPGGYRNSQMPHMSDADGTYYPAPIPVELKLPPLLSKKNQAKAKKGRPMSRRLSFMRPDSVVAFPPPPVWHVDTGVTASDRRSMLSRRLSNASTLNAFRQSGEFDRKSTDFDRLSVDLGDHIYSEHEGELGDVRDDKGDDSHGEDDEANFERSARDSSTYDIKGKGVSAPLRDDDAEAEGNYDSRASVLTTGEGRIGELRDDSWDTNRVSTMEPRTYSHSVLGEYYDGFEDYEDSDDGIKSDCATIQSDEEYQEDILVDEAENAKLAAETRENEGMGLINGASIDDFAFTSFNPNSAITDRGLLAGSINYSSAMLPAVGVQPPSLIEELEMRKATRKARLQRTYYDSNTGNAIATETVGRMDPTPDQLLREPNSGHPLDARHSKSLLELQYIADQDYEEQKNYRHGIYAAAESDRMSRMGFSTTNLLSPNPQQGLLIEEGDPDESLGARRARLKKKRAEEALLSAEEKYQNETLAERRARLKKEKLLLKQEKEQGLGVSGGLQSEVESFTSQPSAIAT